VHTGRLAKNKPIGVRCLEPSCWSSFSSTHFSLVLTSFDRLTLRPVLLHACRSLEFDPASMTDNKITQQRKIPRPFTRLSISRLCGCDDYLASRVFRYTELHSPNAVPIPMKDLVNHSFEISSCFNSLQGFGRSNDNEAVTSMDKDLRIIFRSPGRTTECGGSLE
jgi:hypothetical protein